MAYLRGVSLFSNCGAGDVGYRDAGFRFEVMAELEQHRLDVALLNHPRARGVAGDLRVTLAKVLELWSERRGDDPPALLAACPPCQGMSTARGTRGSESDPEAGSRDPRNLLVQVVAEAAAALRPRAVVVENVPAFLTRQVLHPETGAAMSAAVLLIEEMSADYVVWPVLADLADFGVPQTRKRTFLTFIRADEPAAQTLLASGLAPYPVPSHENAPTSLRSALGSMRLGGLDAGSADSAVDTSEPLHRVPVWTPERYAMVAAIPPNSGATAWENSQCRHCEHEAESKEDALCPKCGLPLPRPVVTDASGTRLISGFRRTSYGRMDPDRPASTITTSSGRVGSDRTIHPWENRLLSPLECQLLQGIPLDFRWGPSLQIKGHTAVRSMIGEAVPPVFTRQHGRVLRSLLDGRRPRLTMDKADRRIARADKALLAARERSQLIDLAQVRPMEGS